MRPGKWEDTVTGGPVNEGITVVGYDVRQLGMQLGMYVVRYVVMYVVGYNKIILGIMLLPNVKTMQQSMASVTSTSLQTVMVLSEVLLDTVSSSIS